MTPPTTDRPGPTRVGRPADPPVDRDERRIRVTIDALGSPVGPGGDPDDGARSAALRALLDDGDVAAEPGVAAEPA